MKSIQTQDYTIHFNTASYIALNKHLAAINYLRFLFLLMRIRIITACQIFLAQLESSLDIEAIQIETGEIHKTIETCVGVWETLSDLGADRKKPAYKFRRRSCDRFRWICCMYI